MQWWTDITNIGKLRSWKSEEQIAAAKQLGRPGNKKAVEPLVALLREHYFALLGAVNGALKQIGEPAVEPLIAALANSDAQFRKNAASTLGEMGDLCAVDPLIRLLKDSEWKVRNAAARALGELGNQRAVDALTSVLNDSASQVSETAAESLDAIGDHRAIEPLFRALKDSKGRVNSGIAEALGSFGDKRAAAAIIEQLQNTKAGFIYHYTVTALGRIGDETAIEPLLKVCQDALRTSQDPENSHNTKCDCDTCKRANAALAALKSISERLNSPNEKLNKYLQQVDATKLAKSEAESERARQQRALEEKRVRELIQTDKRYVGSCDDHLAAKIVRRLQSERHFSRRTTRAKSVRDW